MGGVAIHSIASADAVLWERRLWLRVRWYALALLAFMAYPATSKVDLPAIIGLCVFTVAYVRVIWRNTPVAHRNQSPCWLALALAAGAADIPALGSDWLSGYGFFAAILLLISFDPRWQRRIWVGVPTVLLIVGIFGLRAPGHKMLTLVVLLLLAISILLAGFRMLHTEIELRNGRAELARLAVENERMRIARDVHDILGQHLSAVVIKSELAARQPANAQREMLEVAAIAREALAEIRAAICGYRRTSLAVEAQAARALLDAAGVDVELSGSFDELPDAVDEVAGWVLREATTNVIRHAQATKCRIELSRLDDDVVLEIRDDGVGVAGGSDVSWGNGLTGLGERVSLAGGALRTHTDEGWFAVRAVLPAAANQP